MPPRETWTPAHDETLLRAMTALLLANRRALYLTPGLQGVADHGGERINKKIQAFARRMAGEHAAIVGDELGQMARGGKRGKGEGEDVKEEGVGGKTGAAGTRGPTAAKVETDEGGDRGEGQGGRKKRKVA